MIEAFLLLVLTVVIIIKLNQQLGQHNGFFRQQREDLKVQDIPAHKIRRVAVGYEEISEIDTNFMPEDFLTKCTEVFKYVVQNFYRKNLADVRNFIDASFLQQIELKLEGVAKQEVEFLDRVLAKIVKHEVSGDEARIWIHFDSTQKIGENITDHSDTWVFRKFRGNQPNWYLLNIES